MEKDAKRLFLEEWSKENNIIERVEELLDWGNLNRSNQLSHDRSTPFQYISASKGFKAASDTRSRLSARMTPSDIYKAQELARECVKKEYKGC